MDDAFKAHDGKEPHAKGHNAHERQNGKREQWAQAAVCMAGENDGEMCV